MRFRFTIRDLLWLTALVAMGVAWWLDHRRLTKQYEDYQRWMTTTHLDRVHSDKTTPAFAPSCSHHGEIAKLRGWPRFRRTAYVDRKDEPELIAVPPTVVSVHHGHVLPAWRQSVADPTLIRYIWPIRLGGHTLCPVNVPAPVHRAVLFLCKYFHASRIIIDVVPGE